MSNSPDLLIVRLSEWRDRHDDYESSTETALMEMLLEDVRGERYSARNGSSPCSSSGVAEG